MASTSMTSVGVRTSLSVTIAPDDPGPAGEEDLHLGTVEGEDNRGRDGGAGAVAGDHPDVGAGEDARHGRGPHI